MKILIAEDDLICQKVLTKFLQDVGDITVASDGAEAWKLYQEAVRSEHPYELVCLDIMMPYLSGKDVLAKIREHEHDQGSPLVKILMTTALSDTDTIVSSFQTGCEAYITKPIERAQLHDELGRLGIAVNTSH